MTRGLINMDRTETVQFGLSVVLTGVSCGLLYWTGTFEFLLSLFIGFVVGSMAGSLVGSWLVDWEADWIATPLYWVGNILVLGWTMVGASVHVIALGMMAIGILYFVAEYFFL